MKKTILYVITCVMIASSVSAMPSSKVLQRFNATFPNAQNVKWIDDKAGYFVSFTQGGDFNKVFYNTAGSFVYAIKYCNAGALPTNVVMELNKKYGESKTLGVTEVTTQSNLFYNVKFSKEGKLYNVNVSPDGSVTKEEVFDDGTASN